MKKTENKKENRNILSVLAWLLILVMLAAAAFGGYYILRIKPNKEAQEKYRLASEDYAAEVLSYKKAVDAYNKKIDAIAAENERLEDAAEALREAMQAEKPFSAAVLAEAEEAVSDALYRAGNTPAKMNAEDALRELPYSGDETQEILTDTAQIRLMIQELADEESAVREETGALEVPDCAADIAHLSELIEKLDASVLDPFDNLVLTYSGIEPEGTANWSKRSDTGIYSLFDFSLDSYEHLSNGDVITVTVKPAEKRSFEELNDLCAEEYGQTLLSETKTFTVDALSHYITSGSQISEDTLRKMQRRAEEHFYSTAENSWGRDVSVDSFTYKGNYFQKKKKSGRGFLDYYKNNHFYLVYEVGCTIDLTEKGKNYKEKVNYIYTFAYEDLLNLGDGTSAVNLDDWKEPGDSFKIDTGIKSGLFSRYVYTFKGYRDLDAAFNRILAEGSEMYEYEDNVS